MFVDSRLLDTFRSRLENGRLIDPARLASDHDARKHNHSAELAIQFDGRQHTNTSDDKKESKLPTDTISCASQSRPKLVGEKRKCSGSSRAIIMMRSVAPANSNLVIVCCPRMKFLPLCCGGGGQVNEAQTTMLRLLFSDNSSAFSGRGSNFFPFAQLCALLYSGSLSFARARMMMMMMRSRSGSRR